MEKSNEFFDVGITPTEYQEFVKPLEFYEISFMWATFKGNTRMVSPYISTSDLRKRLLRLGAHNYEVKHVTPFELIEENAKNEDSIGVSAMLRIAIKTSSGYEWREMTGVAEKTGHAPIKGTYTSAIKHAAGFFGIARELYDFPKITIIASTTLSNDVPQWVTAKIHEVFAQFKNGSHQDAYTFKEIEHLMNEKRTQAPKVNEF